MAAEELIALTKHGARLTKAMTHIAIQEALDSKVVDWMEKGIR